MQSLDIPLNDNPTRQKTWRVVVFLAPLILTAALSAIAFRAYLITDTLSAFSPASSEIAIRFIKTPETAAVLEDKFHGTQLFSNAPFTLDELSNWSTRESEVFMNQTGIVGVAVAGKVPQSAIDEAKALGFVVVERFGGTYIGTEAPASTKFGLRLPIALMLPWFNGEVYSSALNTHAPIKLTKRSLTITGFGRPPATSDSTSDASLVNINVSKEEAQSILGFDVPLVFPGLRSLEEQMIAQGFTLRLGSDSEGTPYSISVPEGNLPKENIESVVSELFYSNNLSIVESTDVYTSLDEIISSSTAEPITTSDPSATITSITDNTGTTIRAAQSSHNLVLTNRPVILDGSNHGVTVKNSCLGNANQWVSLLGLSKLLPANLSTPGWTIATKVLNAEQIAFSKNRTRICW